MGLEVCTHQQGARGHGQTHALPASYTVLEQVEGGGPGGQASRSGAVKGCQVLDKQVRVVKQVAGLQRRGVQLLAGEASGFLQLPAQLEGCMPCAYPAHPPSCYYLS